MIKKLSRIYLLATFTVVLFSTQNLLAESIVLFSRDFTDGSLSPFTPEETGRLIIIKDNRPRELNITGRQPRLNITTH